MIAGIIAFALLMAMLGLMIGGISAMPLKNFFLDGFWQNFLAWSTLILFLGVPVIGLIIWLIRRLIGAKSKNPYLGYIFGGLWTLGWVSVICLAALITANYRTKAGVQDKLTIAQPSNSKLYLKVTSAYMVNYYGSDWYGIHWDGDDAPFYGLNEDSLMLRTVQVRVVKSDDSSFHISLIKFSRGNTPQAAKNYASNINFNPVQNDSLITLPKGFTITQNEKYRNQQIVMIVEVPVNKKIELNKNLQDYKWIDIQLDDNHNEGWATDWSDNWQTDYHWRGNVEYIMTDNGLKPTHASDEYETDENTDDTQQQLDDIRKQQQDLNQKQKELENSLQKDSSKYHYQPAPKIDTAIILPKNKKAKEVTPAVQAQSNSENIFRAPSGILLMKIS